MLTATLAQRPSLERGAKLRFDKLSGAYVLLSPERGLKLNASAADILQRCDGSRSVATIVEELLTKMVDSSAAAAGFRAEITRDVMQLLFELRQRGLLRFEAAP